MEQTITAIYERGLLRPLETLDLAEHEPVQVRILRRKKLAQPMREPTEYARALRTLQRTGLVKPRKARTHRRILEKRRRALERALSVGKPLSEIVIEGRD
ncbi:MAG TPA: antitoxin family protein [Anaerolineae bacterium]